MSTGSVRSARILVADHQLLVAEGIGRLLEREFQSVRAADNFDQLLGMAQEFCPDVILLDVSIPELTLNNAVLRLKQKALNTRIIFLSAHDDPRLLREVMSAGASGYFLKRSAGSELLDAVEKVWKGGTYIPESFDTTEADLSARCREMLTQRQRAVLKLIAQGLSAEEVAGSLGISAKTAGFHKEAIKQKLGIYTTAGLTQYAVNHGIVGGFPKEQHLPGKP